MVHANQRVCVTCNKSFYQDDSAQNSVVCFEEIDLRRYAGNTLKTTQTMLNRLGAIVYELRPLIHRDEWRTSGSQDENTGWRDHKTDPSPISMEYVIQAGDSTRATVVRFYCDVCYRLTVQANSENEIAEVLQIIQKALRDAAFDDAEIKRQPPPSYIALAFCADDSEEDQATFTDALRYFQVTSSLGSFGIFAVLDPSMMQVAVPLMIDLAGTGILQSDLIAESRHIADAGAFDLSSTMQNFCSLSFNGTDYEPLVILRRLLRGHQHVKI